MKFEEAMVFLRKGHLVRRDKWDLKGSDQYALGLVHGKLRLVSPTWGAGFVDYSSAAIVEEWVLAEDWQVVWSPKLEEQKQL